MTKPKTYTFPCYDSECYFSKRIISQYLHLQIYSLKYIGIIWILQLELLFQKPKLKTRILNQSCKPPSSPRLHLFLSKSGGGLIAPTPHHTTTPPTHTPMVPVALSIMISYLLDIFEDRYFVPRQTKPQEKVFSSFSM